MTFLKDPKLAPRTPLSRTVAKQATKGGADGPSADEKKAAKKPAKKAGHDPITPPALLEFMVQGWKKPGARRPEKVAGAARFAARRAALSKRFPGETLVVPTGHEKVRANDTHYPFRPGSDFYYLTGNLEPDCVLVLEPLREGGHRSVLYVEPNPGKTDATFFTDRVKGELWVGPRLGVPESLHRYGVDECRALADLGPMLEGLAASPGARVLRGLSASVEGALGRAKATSRAKASEALAHDRELAAFLSELRLVKDALEVRELERSIASTERGFEDVIRRLASAESEREVEGVFFLRARVEGNDVGYGTIAAAGAHACTLHWTRNDGPVRKGELLLLDAGVEGKTLYTADVTRTLPISGTFSPEQRAIYELVLAAQDAALAEVAPGADFLAPNRAAMRVLTQGLIDLGILKVGLDEALDDKKQLHRRYTLHNVSHMLGLDVHDCAHARQQEYKYGKLKAGMVLTVEPGLYFQIDDLTVPARYRGIGVRIEDDVLVTPKGYRNLSASIPRATADVERWMARVWAEQARA